MQPKIELIPLKPALCPQIASTLDVLVRITPPALATPTERPDLNLSLVLDRSGSMGGHNKMPYAKAAAQYAVEQLALGDRVSVVTFDNQVETPIPSTLAGRKEVIINAIQAIQPRGSTALHAGWLEGGMQVSQHLKPEHLNRVMLLSDGQANVGETNPDVIGQDVRGLAQRGVSTTTLGVGDDYDEILLEAIAASGDGSYYYIASPDQLPDIFQQELQGLMATLGRNVRLGAELAPGVVLLDCFNDFKTLATGDYSLPNLIAESPFTAALRLQIPIQTGEPLDWLAQVKLTWNDVETGAELTTVITLALPWVSQGEWEALPFNGEVQQEVAVLTVARAKKEAASQAKRGEYGAAMASIRMAQADFQDVCFSMDTEVADGELLALADLAEDLEAQNYSTFTKRSHYESHLRGRGSSQSQYQDYQKQRSQQGSSGQGSGTSLPAQGQSGSSRSVIPAHTLQDQVQQGVIQAILGDITKIPADAIVNATNSLLTGSTGVDAALHRAAGSGLQAECRQLRECPVGQAVVTNAYLLPARWVIHTPGPAWQGGHQGEENLLRSCYGQSLRLALQQGAKSITFPAISTGALGFPLDRAAAIAIKAVSEFLLRYPAIQQVTFVCFDQTTLAAYQTRLPHLS
ncbi:macro domain-containing protein [Prochlorothrix hollandica]|uniref:Appr-1-p processing protein n=1 Tax=Prochlorothrix hollandica PCC 9006 = CALU 1027 TaxID=317619 RepID=A0A0M2PYC7_PROHO|nr:macro domain-containing protein [Prochlorothrix hollandica]KKJ01436.1 hypothetical protein PROH_03630 [Prochlorothrix hollandica PCC 9006 = CALU 1027]